MSKKNLLGLVFGILVSLPACELLVELRGPAFCTPGEPARCDGEIRVTCEGEGHEVRHSCGASLCDEDSGRCLSCGNGAVDDDEACDDGNNLNDDGCSADCLRESELCGNNILDPGEACDDGNNLNDDGCNNICACTDADNDGFPLVSGCNGLPQDCNDSQAASCPDAQLCPERCDGLDNDCDGLADEDLKMSWYLDADSDGLGDIGIAQLACNQPDGYVANAYDTDDTNSALPGAPLGDWPQLGGGPGHRGYLRGAVGDAKLSLLWSVDVGQAVNQAVLVNDVVYISAGDYSNNEAPIQAYDANSGELLWSYNLPEDAHSINPPSWGNGRVFVQRGNHAQDTQLWCVNAMNGELLWSSPHEAQWERYLAPTIAEGRVLVNGGYYGGIYGFSADTGAQSFFLGLEQFDEWTPAYANGVAYSYVEGKVRAHNPDSGAVQWTADLGWDWSGWSMNTAPVVVDGVVYVASSVGLFAVDTATHNVRWSAPGNFGGIPTIDRDSVYAIDLNTNALRRYKKEDGALRQTYPSEFGLTGQPLVTDDVVIAVYYEATHVFNKESGELIERLPLGENAVIGNGKLVLTDSYGTISVYQWQ